MVASVTFIEQDAPVDEYGRALYAVARSIIRAQLDSLTTEDLTDLNTPLADVRMRQLAKAARLERDKGLRGDGFEWAVHEAVLGKEPSVVEPLAGALKKASRYVKDAVPTSVLFGHERARYLGFLDAVIDEAGTNAYLLPQGNGRPYRFGKWVSRAARGQAAEPELNERIRQIWKTDLFWRPKETKNISRRPSNRTRCSWRVARACESASFRRRSPAVIEPVFASTPNTGCG